MTKTLYLLTLAAILSASLLGFGDHCQAQVWGSNTGPGGGFVDELVADSTRPGTVYAFNPTEFYRSDDAGQTWTTPASTGISTYGRMVVDPTRGGALFMATTSGVYRSDDAGESWAALNAGFYSAIGIDVATGTLYVGEGAGNGAFRSIDGGASWLRVHDLRDPAWLIRTDPSSPGTVYIVSRFDWLYVSEDGGDTWEERKDLYKVHGGGGFALAMVGFELDASQAGVLYFAASDSVYRSANFGNSWSRASKGLPQGSTVRGLAADRTVSGVLYAATASGVYRSIDGGARWAWAGTGVTHDLNPATGVSRALISLVADSVDPDRLYLGTDTGDVFVQLCGNGQLDPGEVCDDDNTADGDGCSSKCRGERYLDKIEQRCVKGMNAKGLAIAKKQSKENLVCFDGGADGTETDPQSCLTADANGHIAAKRAALGRAEPRLCVVQPPYGKESPDDVADAAVEELAGLVGDLFGGDLTVAQIDPAIDPAGSQCQREIVDASQGLFAAYARTFFTCKKKRMKGRTWPRVGAADDLGDCIEEDTGRLSRAGIRLRDVLCSGVDLNVAFPNGHLYPRNHFGRQVRCRVCRMVNRMDGAAHDCDAFDGDAIGSCP